ncbi:MAG: Endonuclease III [Pelotomaculum sp. PtaB.Bin013]|uniref:Endonuclease III n=1 Tax=Pelotomaculum isophthalicicum JI TaxID=947010 RepID=A0A9X4H6K5_9FIRM|nr:endonuclease III [Pelotomaculum isophthalicicum]MDF9408963.1 endonuclease III [Pelotomaculum isophthalicicum JI]OPX87315.1 MAG: Endonuclease III [Pelotomaculum sp. PtaB.Bin013]
MNKKEKIGKILNILATVYPDAGTALIYKTPFELMVAAILSAQCADKQVNRVTARLFKKYNTPQEFAALSQEDLAEEIKGCGLYRNKSKYIIEASRELVKRYGGTVPRNRSELESLPGVGSKTAGVVSGVIYGSSALPVDTHVHRIAHRLGLSRASNPRKVEEELAGHIPPHQRMAAHHRLIAHGRKVCLARRPACGNCHLVEFCEYQPKEDRHSCT